MTRDIHDIIGEFVKAKRDSTGLNRVQFAKKIGMARSTLFNIENKVGTCISVANMDIILREIGSSWSELGKILDTNGEIKND